MEIMFDLLLPIHSWAASFSGLFMKYNMSAVKNNHKINVFHILMTLNDIDLAHHTTTDLVEHHIHLAPNTKPFSVAKQRRLAPIKEHWLQKIVQQGMEAGIHERTVVANGCLSRWNARAVVVDKVENPIPEDEPRLAFDYSNVKEIMPGNHLELASKVHDYLSDPRHSTYFQADLKHGYYGVRMAKEGRHYLANPTNCEGQVVSIFLCHPYSIIPINLFSSEAQVRTLLVSPVVRWPQKKTKPIWKHRS